MTDLDRTDHLSAPRLQALLDGELPAGEAAAARAHVDGCARCRAEMDAWESLFDDLDDLPALAPSPAFRGRIMDAVPAGRPARARVRRRAPRADHPASGRLQDYLEGRLAARAETSIDEHLDTCAVCRSELAAFRTLGIALDGLPRWAPSPEFGERVMAAWSVERMARVAMAPTTRWGRVAAWVRSRAPSSRQGWAAALGLATAPAIIVALLVQAVFSSPLVTVGNLVAFLRLQLADAVGALAARLSEVLASAGLEPVARMALDALSAPAVAAGAATLASGLTLAALWVVYRFLIASQPANRPYAPVSR